MMQVVDVWKKFSHPNCVALREVFTTKAFGDNSLILVYDLQPGMYMMKEYVCLKINLLLSQDHTLSYRNTLRLRALMAIIHLLDQHFRVTQDHLVIRIRYSDLVCIS